MNFIPVEFHAPLLITHSQFRLTLPQIWESALQKYDGQTLILGVRPEHFIVSVPATKNLPVLVDLVENLGNDSFISARLGEAGFAENTGDYLQVRVPPERLVNVGDQLWLSLIPEKIHFFDPMTDLAIFPQAE
ncbi:TOBE domain-containing protein [Calothrix anomala]